MKKRFTPSGHQPQDRTAPQGTILCQACGSGDAVFHITVSVNIFGPCSVRTKLVQVVLCSQCELAMQQVFMRDEGLKSRIAARFTAASDWMSRTPKWVNNPRDYNSMG